MSFAAHEFELYVIQKHLGLRIAFIPLIVGDYILDVVTTPLVYGLQLFGTTYKAVDPAQFHRGWPGVGFTHSLLFGYWYAFLWGTGRRIFWFSRAHIYHRFPFGLSWGGPFWAQGLH